MKTFRAVIAASLLTAALLWAVNPVFTTVNRDATWPPQAGSSYKFGGPYEIYWQAVPTALTDFDTRDVHIIGYCFYNPTGGSITLTIQTKDASPLALPLSGPIATGISVCTNAPFGILSKGGWSAQAGGAGALMSAVWTH